MSCVWGHSHELIEAKLKESLSASRKHLLLVVPGIESSTKALLVEGWKREYKNRPKFMCKFVGSLFFKKPLGVNGCATKIITIGDPEAGWEKLGNESEINGIMEMETHEQMKEKESGPESPKSKFERDWGWTALQHAAWLGNISTTDVAATLNKQEGRRQQDCLGQRALHLAAERGNETFVTSLLGNGDYADDVDSNGQTPLHRAAWGGSVATVKLLREKSKHPDTRDKAGNTALHIAADMGFKKVAKYLCKPFGIRAKPFNIRAKGRNGLTPLHYAAMSGRYEMVKLLVNLDTIIDAKDHKIGWTPLHCAAENGHTAVVKLLLNRGAKFEETDDKVGWTPLHFAAMKGHWEIVKALLRRNANVNAKDNIGWTPLHFAAMNAQRVVVEQLRKHPAIDNTIFDWMAGGSKSYEAVIEWITKNNAKFSPATPTRLHLLAIDRRTTMTRSVVASDMTVGEISNKGISDLMHWAARDGLNGTLSFLSQIGTGIDVADDTGRTPLHFAAENGHGVAVQWLFNEGAEIEAKDRYGRTPLHCAAAKGHEAAVQQLLNRGARVETRDNTSRTPLHLAAEKGHEDVVQ